MLDELFEVENRRQSNIRVVLISVNENRESIELKLNTQAFIIFSMLNVK